MVRWWLTALACALAGPALSLQLELPSNARQTAARDSALDRVQIAIAPFADGAVSAETIDGPVQRRSYRVTSPGLTPLQILAPLRDQLLDAGYETLLDCDADTCGGFDFRFAIDVLPAPNMYVNVRAYHFLSARHPQSGDAVWLLASTAPDAGYLQVVQVGTQRAAVPTAEPPYAATPTESASDLGQQLLANGSVILRSLDFEVGTTRLGEGPAPELEQIAQLMTNRPGLRIAVVGHTDTVGGLEANITVSRARARAVRERLISRYDVSPSRIEAEGMGYLSPVASNLTAAGREANRRVEVIVLSDAP
ncbi:OmpA family protein [Tateyamaria omphalii]|uniref:OmpA family protein n=1 Tax=Tateyamaria omphalii TaxID=299262 RepID=UPI001C993E10|nr:OmpA family protein [Tateyamaria omphalii]MBY5935390.1 OmpA family protein [Tateyamaria omphalii]